MPLIIPLADRPDLIPTLARWFVDEWGDVDGRPLPQVEEQLRGNLGRDTVPMTWLAMEGDVLVGTISLDRHDLPGFDHLSPWLACLYVVREHRQRGIARRLVEHLIGHAQRIGVPVVYLWTWNLTSWYGTMGWRTIDHTEIAGHGITVMRRDLASEK